MAVAIAIFAYPVVRGLTRRIERLQTGVETLGAGNFATRVAVEGRDEVAQLAASFNRAAARIEELVGAHRLLLANASHELRTPLSRIRLGVEPYETKPSPKIKTDLARDIAELDNLIEEILLASRLDSAVASPVQEDVDLLALAAEECARDDGCMLDGEAVALRGEAMHGCCAACCATCSTMHGITAGLPCGSNCGATAGRLRSPSSMPATGSRRPHASRRSLPFRRVHDAPSLSTCAGGKGGSAGLGLALVRQIARLHGGDAMAIARANAKSCIVVTLPVCG